MKREVWVKADKATDFRLVILNGSGDCYLSKQTINESRWIPVSERMPDKCHVGEEFLVMRLGRKESDMLFNEENLKVAFTHSNVTHWLEAPPLPEEDEFHNWLTNYLKEPIHSTQQWTIEDVRAAWNAAKGLDGHRP